jgi:pimeloyl-ACP methyl ester carboxylesterase
MTFVFPAAALLIATLSAIAQPYPPPGKLIDVGGYRVHLYCTGDRGPAVIITGASASFDWALVQPEVAKFARVCTYDRSGTAWSDPGPLPTCSQRADELHALLDHAGVAPPYVLVGHSVGAIVARIYANRHAAEVAGMVIVDHAFGSPDPPKPRVKGTDSAPAIISQTPIVLDKIEDSPAFKRLPERDQKMHLWAAAQPESQERHQATIGCLNEAPGSMLGSRPLIVVSQANVGADYLALQMTLLALSTNSKQMIAGHSGHSIEIERPDAVISAIRQVAAAVRNKTRMTQ